MKYLTHAILAAAFLAAGCSTNELGHVSATEGGDLSHGVAPREPFAAAQIAACGDGSMTERGMSELLRAPYLQRVTDEGAWLLWTSTGPGGSVAVTTVDGAAVTEVDAEVDDSAPLPEGRQYVAKIAGLEPSTIYCYELRDSGDALVARTGFRTAPTPGDASYTVSMVSFGDMGETTSDQDAVLSQMMTLDYDFALLNGDNAYEDGTLSQFEDNVFGVYGPLMRNVPFFPASGNHEYHTADAAPFREVFALFENGGPNGIERWYSFDWGPVHVVVLDTEKVNSAQESWLDADLAANDLPWTIAVGHRPPYSSGHHGSNVLVRDTFSPLFEKYGVDLTFWGHDHDYERTNSINGVVYVVSGGGGVGTRSVGSSDFTAFSDQVAHFVYLEVDEHELRLWAIDASGKDFDSLVIQK